MVRILITGQANKVLQIRIFCNLLYKFPVRELEFFLDNQNPQRHAQRLCNINHLTREQISLLPFQLIPRDEVSHANPSIFRIHLHSQWLIEITERMLEFIKWVLHALFGSFRKKYRHNLQEKSSYLLFSLVHKVSILIVCFFKLNHVSIFHSQLISYKIFPSI